MLLVVPVATPPPPPETLPDLYPPPSEDPTMDEWKSPGTKPGFPRAGGWVVNINWQAVLLCLSYGLSCLILVVMTTGLDVGGLGQRKRQWVTLSIYEVNNGCVMSWLVSAKCQCMCLYPFLSNVCLGLMTSGRICQVTNPSTVY